MHEQDLVLCSANQWIYPLTCGEALCWAKRKMWYKKSGGAEPLPKLSLDLSLTRPAVLVNSQLRMLVLDLLQYFMTLVRKSAALDHLSMNWD